MFLEILSIYIDLYRYMVMINQSEVKEIEAHYYRIKTFDYNDVYDYDTYVYGTYEQVKEYLVEQYKEEYRSQLDIDESHEDIFVGIYMPVTDEDGNEVDPIDDRYEELQEQQEALLDISYLAELQETKDISDGIRNKVIDLTKMSKEEFDETLRQKMNVEIRNLEVRWNCVGRWIKVYN